MRKYRNILLYAFLLAIFTSAGAHARANEASAWSGPEQGQMRLLAGGVLDGGKLYAGIEVKLDKGWKTYWRTPGDSGIPPFFDWAGSQNVADVQVRFPAPKRFRDDFGLNIGYKSDVVFPLEITPEDKTKPVSLKLKAQYGVCSNICIPAEAELALNIPHNSSGGYLPQIQSALDRVPTNSLEGVKIEGASAKASGKKVELEVLVKTDDDAQIDVFVEGPKQFYFDTPKPQASSNTYTLRVDGAKSPSDLKGAKLTVTVVRGQDSLEQDIVLD